MKKGIYAALMSLAVFFLALVGCDNINNLFQNTVETETYIVKFDKNTDARGTTEAIPKNKKVIPPAKYIDKLPTEPTWQYHAFMGWYTSPEDDEGVEFDDTTVVTASITVYARWQEYSENTCLVTFNSNGGSEIDNRRVQIDKGQTFFQSGKKFPLDPDRKGFLFTGWSTKQKGGSTFNFTVNTRVDDDITVYAQWEQEQAGMIKVVFWRNTGKNPEVAGSTDASPKVKQVALDDTIGKLPEEPTQPYAKFISWNIDKKGGGEEFTAETIITKEMTALGYLDVYAQWEKLITVTFDKNHDDEEGFTEADPQIVTIDPLKNKVDAFPEPPTRAGYIFMGWYTGFMPIDGDEFTISSNVFESMSVYAGWKQDTFTVTFNANGGTPAPDPQYLKTDDMVTEPPVMTKENFYFDGWYKEATFINRWDFDKDTVKNVKITLHAKWTAQEAEKIIVSFVTNEGSAVADQQVTKTTGTVTEPSTSQTGYTLDGWYTDAVFTPANKWIFTNPVGATNFSLYAKWTYSVTFDANGATGTAPTALVATKGANITIPAGTGLTKTGFAFDGWNTLADGTGTNYNAGASFSSSSGNTTLYAKWTAASGGASGLKITVDNVEQTVDVTGVSGTVEYKADQTGYTFTRSSAWEASYAYFGVNFGASDNLSNYGKVMFKYQGVAGDIGYKKIFIVASTTSFTGNLPTSNNRLNASVWASGAFAEGPSVDGTGETNITLIIPKNKADTFAGSTVYFSIYINANANTSGTATAIKVSDIAFVKDGGAVTGTTLDSIKVKTAPTKDTYDTTDVFDPTGLIITANNLFNTAPTTGYAEDVVYNASTFTFKDNSSTAITTTTVMQTVYPDQTVTVTVVYQTKEAAFDVDVGNTTPSAFDSAEGMTIGIEGQGSATFANGIIDLTDTSSSALFIIAATGATSTSTITIKYICKAVTGEPKVILKNGGWGTDLLVANGTDGCNWYPTLTVDTEATLVVQGSWYTNPATDIWFQRNGDSNAFKIKIISVEIE